MSKFQLKEKFDKYIYRLFNIISDLLFFFNFKIKRLVKGNLKYKNKHKGDRAFILGTGPSLKTLNQNHFNFLAKNKTFAVNFFYKIDSLVNFHPTYYSIVDPIAITDKFKVMFEEFQKRYKDTILIADYRAKLRIDDLNLLNETIYLYAKKYPINYIECDISKNCYITMNVVSMTILTAIYMGFKEIYLLGTDYNSFASRNETHFYEEDKKLSVNIENRLGYQLKFYSITTQFHYIIAEYARKNNIKIINLCETTLLDAYPIGRIEDLMQN